VSISFPFHGWRPPVTPPVVRNRPVAVRSHHHHLVFECIRAQRPPWLNTTGRPVPQSL
jgi:hypothetical protein